MMAGHFSGASIDPFLGLALWSAAIAMFVTGHAIEGNVMTMTPVLLARLAKRSLVGHLGKQHVHLAR
jgi:hypothetical protein